MTATITRINGHDAAHQLQQLRQARTQIASALYMAQQYLEMARIANQINALPYAIPKDTAIADALDTVNRDLNGTPPQAA